MVGEQALQVLAMAQRDPDPGRRKWVSQIGALGTSTCD